MLAAFSRSVGLGQSELVSGAIGDRTGNILVVVNSNQDGPPGLLRWLVSGPRKLVVFGEMPTELARHLGVEIDGVLGLDEADYLAKPASPGTGQESNGRIRYTSISHDLGGFEWQRPLCRYDFADEWNNLGYGAIKPGSTIWSLGGKYQFSAGDELAIVERNGDDRLGAYAGLFARQHHSVLWFNRPVGPIDSYEWRLIENFLSGHRADELPIQPIISEIPFGYDAVVTARLDCDEDVASAESLVEFYAARGVPLSLAILTRLLDDPKAIAMIQKTKAHGGSILSHSASHPSYWGGCYDRAYEEAQKSAEHLFVALGEAPKYAVSPFHQTPKYALTALAAAGYEGCVGGVISAEPAFNMARGGQLAGMDIGFVGHTQQCMLHGDCMLSDANPLAVYHRSFQLAFETRSMFAYLDHPFSERYQYGWDSEAARQEAHADMLDFVSKLAQNPLFLNLDDTLDFLQRKSIVEIASTNDGFLINAPGFVHDGLAICVEYGGESFELKSHLRLA